MTKAVEEQSVAKSEAARVGVLVLGMHRSGTSALSRVLSLLGCDLPKTLIGEDATNETGHWESNAIMRLNEEILESAGTNWHDWLVFNPGWYASPKVPEFREKALAVLHEEFEGSRLLVLKDPRICRFAPFWLDVFKTAGIRPAVIMPVRNPLEVAEFLAKRNGFDPALGHLLWLRHLLEAEVATRGLQRFYCSYEGLLDSWPRLISGMQEQLEVSWPRLSPMVSEEVDGFLTDRLRHHRESSKSVSDNPLLSAWLRDTFAIFRRWSEEGEATDDHAVLDRIRGELDGAAPAFARLISVGHQSAQKANALDASLKKTQDKLSEAELRLRLMSARSSNPRANLKKSAPNFPRPRPRSRKRSGSSELQSIRSARTELADVQAEAQSQRSELEAVRAELKDARAELSIPRVPLHSAAPRRTKPRRNCRRPNDA